MVVLAADDLSSDRWHRHAENGSCGAIGSAWGFLRLGGYMLVGRWRDLVPTVRYQALIGKAQKRPRLGVFWQATAISRFRDPSNPFIYLCLPVQLGQGRRSSPNGLARVVGSRAGPLSAFFLRRTAMRNWFPSSANPANAGQVMENKGLWRYTRHPI